MGEFSICTHDIMTGTLLCWSRQSSCLHMVILCRKVAPMLYIAHPLPLTLCVGTWVMLNALYHSKPACADSCETITADVLGKIVLVWSDYIRLKACRRRHADVLEWVWFLQTHRDSLEGMLHGDKDLFQLAFHLANKSQEWNQVSHCCLPSLIAGLLMHVKPEHCTTAGIAPGSIIRQLATQQHFIKCPDFRGNNLESD